MSITGLHDARASRHTSRIAAAMCVALASAGTIAPFAARAAETKADVKVERDAQKAEADREKQLADARKRLDDAAREVAELSMDMSDDAMPRVTRMFHRMGSKAM